jgi:hypothetical protein
MKEVISCFVLKEFGGFGKLLVNTQRILKLKKKVANAVEMLAKSCYRYTRSEFENSIASLGMPKKNFKNEKNNPK